MQAPPPGVAAAGPTAPSAVAAFAPGTAAAMLSAETAPPAAGLGSAHAHHMPWGYSSPCAALPAHRIETCP